MGEVAPAPARSAWRHGVLAAAVCLALHPGCGVPPPEAPPADSSPPGITLAAEPAAEYVTGEPVAEVDRAVAAEAAQRLPGLAFSSNLARAARELAGSWTGTDLADVSHELITFVLHASGCPDPSAMAALVATSGTGSGPAWHEFAATLAGSREPFTHVGVASAREPSRPRYRRWVMLLVERRLELRPVPRALAPGAEVAVAFTPDAGLGRPEVITRSPHGVIRRVAAAARGAGWEVTIEPGSDPGEHTVEVIADDEHGPQVLALFPVSVAVPAPRSWSGETPPSETGIRSVADAERYLRELTDERRRENGRAALTWDPRLAAVARRHAEDMRDHGFMGHRSPTTGEVGDRLRRAGYPYSFAAENISRSSSLWEAVESLLRSPGHRRNLLATEPTHAGIGVAVATGADGTRTYLVTQVFARPTPSLFTRR